MNNLRLALPISIGICLAIALLHAAGQQANAARPMEPAFIPSATVRYVAATGSDNGECSTPSFPCKTVQYAIDTAASGDEVRIASGVYNQVSLRAGVSQVAFISKTIRLSGGYTLTNWTIPDSTGNPTRLDAQGQGRVIYIRGSISPTVSGLTTINGNPLGLGSLSERDRGGGIYIYGAEATISDCLILTNTASLFGGGIYLENSISVLDGNIIRNNQAGQYGGGVSAYFSEITLVENLIEENTTLTNSGAGIYA
jgi:putative cofactor-binding repeat protein